MGREVAVHFSWLVDLIRETPASQRPAPVLLRLPPTQPMARTNKCLAEINKSRTGGKATKERVVTHRTKGGPEKPEGRAMKPFRIRVTDRTGNISYLVRRPDKTQIRYFTAGETPLAL